MLIFLSVFAYGHMHSNFSFALHWKAENVAWPAGGLQASVQNIEKLCMELYLVLRTCNSGARARLRRNSAFPTVLRAITQTEKVT